MPIAIREPRWRAMAPLLGANLLEHQQVALLDGTLETYEDIDADVLLLGGAKSPPDATAPLRDLAGVIPRAHVELLDGLRRNAPCDQSPGRVAAAVLAHLTE